MARRTLLSILTLASLVLSADFAAAQIIIIQPRDPVKDAENNAKAQLSDWVQTYLGRKATEKEIATMMTRLRSGTNPSLVQASILSSDEYYKKHGSDNRSFVAALFTDVLNQKVNVVDKTQLSAKITTLGREKFVIEFLKTAQGAANPLTNPLTNP